MTLSRALQTTSLQGLRYDLPPMRLWRKAKQWGIWDPEAIDLTQDRQDWRSLNELEQRVLLHLTTLFQAGEESVALDLLPLIQVIAAEGRLEEEMYLTTFLWEEAKHVELFRRFLDEVAECRKDLSEFYSPSFGQLFFEALPQALGRLRDDPSPIAQAEASVTYNMIVEGVLAETGYHAYGQILAKNSLMPGMQQAVANLARDESRHLAYGVFLLSRLVASDREHASRESVWQAIEKRMSELLPSALGIVQEVFASYDVMPFGLELETFTDFALQQFERRFKRIEKAREQTLEEVYRTPLPEIETAAVEEG